MTHTFDTLVDRARALVSDGRRAVLGIAGAPAAGKTTLAEELRSALGPTPPPGLAAGDWVAHVPMDGFHLADVELERLGLRDRKGAPETFDHLGYANLLRRFHEDRDDVIYAPGFERVIEQPIAGSIPVFRAARLIISEGNYLLLWEALRPLLTEVWYADLDDTSRLRRLVDRHVRFGKPEPAAMAWATGTDERNARIVAGTKTGADLVVDADVLHRIGTAPS
ncbi:MAG TPA: nucleoside/nucleotide kinase family protein [Actinoplanes sp.]|jgi:pantothenate kinase